MVLTLLYLLATVSQCLSMILAFCVDDIFVVVVVVVVFDIRYI